MSIEKLLHKLQRCEADAEGIEFVAPRISSCVAIRIAFIIRYLSVDETPIGWGVFRVQGQKALHQRSATMGEIHWYLKRLPRTRLTITRTTPDVWGRVWGQSLWSTDEEKIYFPEPVLLFDTLVCACDGTFFFQYKRSGDDPRIAHYLRESLEKGVSPNNIATYGLTPEQRAAYKLVCDTSAEAAVTREKTRISDALHHAGAELKSYYERDGAYVINYDVDASQFSSVVSKDLGIVTAGFCLDGGDRKQDLATLVSVIREGNRRGRIHRTTGTDYGDYEDD